ncbi:uncharacterized protein N7529_003804 [Penicillium soppii]|uniref:uncharacterized protein n=1 Tax=Penicillium soppii TaxID=69789 RepID=UPI0025486ACE|nr:uncharacterized protein N7529_003804 [Penicillium soppii]KAJ5871451.1 hypothetical protein N7529_003804 [Penicillium soppii]
MAQGLVPPLKDHEDKTLDGFGSIADEAQEVLVYCQHDGMCAGQQCYTDGWNVIVRRDTDRC